MPSRIDEAGHTKAFDWNRYLLLPDDPGEVEMAEAAPRGNRSRSPKKKLRGPLPVVPPKWQATR